MSKSTFERVSEWNTRCAKPILTVGSEAYWKALESQLKRIQSELDETVAGVLNRDMKETLDGGCDLDVVVSGFNFQMGLPYEVAIDRVLSNNDLKYTTDLEQAQQDAERYFAVGMEAEVKSVVDGEEVYHSIHRISDDKILKPIGHPKVTLYDLVVVG